MFYPVMETLPNGHRLRVARIGAGPPIVCLHGYPDNLHIWAALAQQLADFYTVIAFDWPGLGESEPWTGGVTPMHLADRMTALLDFWSIEKTSVVGMDMGGQPALAFAARHPDRIEKLVVMNSLVSGASQTSWEIGLLRKFALNRLILTYLSPVVFQRALWTFLPRGVHLPEDVIADFWRTFRQPSVRRELVRMCAGYQGTLPRLAELYPEIACPTLILWGGRDSHFPPVQAEKLHAQIQTSQLQIIREATHWMAWYLAPEIAAQIDSFLREHAAS
jgi:pimeloyl-ACP methyl ester carboxylesterase